MLESWVHVCICTICIGPSVERRADGPLAPQQANTKPNPIPKPQVVGEVDEKIESNPRLLTCGYGVVFGRLEFVAQQTVRHARG